MTAVFLIIVFLFFSLIGFAFGGLYDGEPMGSHGMILGLSVVVIGSLTVLFDKQNKMQESLRQIEEKIEQLPTAPAPSSAEEARTPKTAPPPPDAAVNTQPPDNIPSKPLSGDGSADTSE